MQFMKEVHSNEHFNPGGVLKDYIYLEASSFFKYAKELKSSKNDQNLPDLPSYIDELKDFRDVMVAHRDRKEKLKFPDDWHDLQRKIATSIPIVTLVKDVNDYYQEVMRRYKKSLKN